MKAQDAINRATTLAGVVGNLDNYTTLADVAVLFGFDQDVLTREGKRQLDQVGSQIANSRGYLLEVTGTTDSIGNADYNYQLSERRAQAVVQYLAIKYNVAPHKFYLIGLGKDQARATRASARAKDRKVEVRLLSNKLGQQPAPVTSGAF
jgi:outer membrane protein OmpA-like peptidoglycan-associated protein